MIKLAIFCNRARNSLGVVAAWEEARNGGRRNIYGSVISSSL